VSGSTAKVRSRSSGPPRRAGRRGHASLSPLPLSSDASETRHGPASNRGEETELVEPSTPPEDGALYRHMERLFNAYRLYERSHSGRNKKWALRPMSGDELERRLEAQLRVASRKDDDQDTKSGQHRHLPETGQPATHRDSRTVDYNSARSRQKTRSRSSSAATRCQLASKKPPIPPPPTSTTETRPRRPETVRTGRRTDHTSNVFPAVTDFTPPTPPHSSRKSSDVNNSYASHTIVGSRFKQSRV